MELRRIKVNADKLPDSWMLPDYQELRILPLGDIQYPETEMDRLKGYVKWANRIQARVIGMGDYPDFESPSGRQRTAIKIGTGYDNEAKGIDRAAEHDVEELAEILEPLTGRFNGLKRGHHWCQFSGDKGSSVTMLAEKLKTENIGDCAMLEIDFGRGLKAHLWAHHGTGSGMVSTSAMTRLEHMTKTFYSDVYLMGHQTKKGVTVIPWIYQDGAKTRGRNRYIVATGGFSPGYSVGSVDAWGEPAGSYVEKRMLIPVALGAPLIMLRPMFDEGRVDINVSV